MSVEDAAHVLAQWPGTHSLGDKSHLGRNLLGMIWSQSWTFDFSAGIDAVPKLRDAGIEVATGFGGAMESMSVELLLEGQQPVIVCLFKAINCYELPLRWRKAIDAGQLLVISPFPSSVRRETKKRVRSRNQFIAAIASAVFIPYALAGSDEEAIARDVIANRKPLFTIENAENQALLRLGAKRCNIDDIRRVTLGLERT